MSAITEFLSQPVLEEEYERYAEAMRKNRSTFGTTKTEEGECYELET